MASLAFSQYRSEAAKNECFAWMDAQAAREWPAKSESRTVLTPWGPTFVRISGPAHSVPLVLLPGAASSSLMWAPNIQDLSADYRTFAVDRIGDFGRSICTRSIPRFRNLVEWFTEFLDALGLRDPVHLVGISYGGALAAEVALHCPARIRKLVLLAPGATVLRSSPRLMGRLAVAIFAHKSGLNSLMRWLFADAVRQQPAWVENTLEQLNLHMRSTRRVAPMPRVWSDTEWASLRVPTLFLVGEDEKIYSPTKALRRLRRVAPQVRGEIIAGAGHDFTFLAAAAVDRGILDFLKDETPQSGTQSGIPFLSVP